MGKQSRAKKERREIREIRKWGEGLREKRPELKEKISRVLLYIIRYGTYLVLFTPLIISAKFYFPFVGPKSLYFMGLAEIIIFSWFCLLVLSPKYRPKFNALAIALSVFFGILVLSSLLGVNFSYSFWSKYERMTGILMWLHLLGFFLATSSVFRKESDWRRLFTVSIFVAVITCLMAFFSKGGSTRGGATIGNTSFLGTYLLFNFFFALYLFFRKKSSWKILYGAAAILMFAAVYQQQARAATISILGGLVLLGFFYLAFQPKKRWLLAVGKGLLVISFLAFLVSAVLFFKQGSFVREEFIKKASQSRLVVWEKAWKGFKERPILGWGQENFEYVFTKYFNPCMFLPECGGEIWFDRAHNIIFDTLVTTGIFGLMSYLGIFIASFFVLWKKYFQGKIGFFTCSVPTVLLIAYSVQNLTVFDMISSYLMFFLVLSFSSAIGEAELMAEDKERLRTKRYRWPLGFLLLAFCFVFFNFIIQPLRADYYVIEALKAQTSEKRLSFYQKTLQTSALGKYQIREFFAQNSQRIVQVSMQELAKDEGKREAAKRELDFVAEELEKTRQETALDFRSTLRLAQLYNLYFLIDPAKLSLAEERGEEAIALSPTNQQGYWSLVQTRVYQGNFQEAFALIQKSIDLESRELQSHKIAVQVAKLTGNIDIGKEFIKKAIELRPEWELELLEILEKGPLPEK